MKISNDTLLIPSGIGLRYATDLWRTASWSILRRRISLHFENGWRKLLRLKSHIT